MTKHELMIHLYNAMKGGYHCWAEWSSKNHWYNFYCDRGRR